MDKTSIKTASTPTGLRPSTATTTAAPLPSAPSLRQQPSLLKQILTPLASLRLTIVLFVLALVIVFTGTLAQMDLSNQVVVGKYFRSFYVWIPFKIFFPHALRSSIQGGFPFLGGWAIGAALLVNLLAAHAVRFRLTWKRSGVLILHAGLICMMLGELVTGLFAVESRMSIVEGASSNYVEDFDKVELVFSIPSKTDPNIDDVIAIPVSKLRKEGTIKDDRLPVDVVIEKYMRNSEQTDVPPTKEKNLATKGEGLKTFVVEKAETSGVDTDQNVNIPSAYVTFKDKTSGKSLGTYLVSVYLSAFGELPQHLKVNDATYDISLRFKRTYKPYTLHLKKFTNDVYPGTDIPKDYASLVQLVDPSRHENREIKIWMNHPLRYEGETFYQSGVLPSSRGTILQVVRNPGWTMPYISCALVVLGMLIHFGFTLIGFIRRKALPSLAKRPTTPLNGRRNGHVVVPTEPTDWGTLGVCSVVLTGAVLLLLMAMTPPTEAANQFHYQDAGKIAVTAGGRSKPLDSVGRTYLMLISGKQTFLDDNKEEHSAMEWLLDVMTSLDSKNRKAANYKVFRIDNPEVLNLLGLEERPGSFRYSLAEILGGENGQKLRQEDSRARKVKESERKLFDIKVLELTSHVQMYIDLAAWNKPLAIDPPGPGQQPISLGDAYANHIETPQVLQYKKMLDDYAKGDVPAFNSTVADYRAAQTAKAPSRTNRADFEVWFNSFAPFYQCMVLYVLVLVLSCVSWLVFQKPLNRAAFWLMLLTFIVHTAALITRMYIQERPPVTNLYSSAVFIGWVAVGLLLIVERIFPYSIATFLGGIIGFSTLLIAHYLSMDGDTMEMMRAVLDTNFWLATHVTAVTIGYAATFVAGFLGLLYIGASVYNTFTGKLDRDLFTTIAGYMLYGVVCFAMLFSFTGTVLGGIWADQSWGRFWGWDAKENGALLIVIWNALILHARWSGLVKARGMAGLAVFGNIITAWSWFGVNMLGVGLHSYGFMQGALAVLLTFVATQVVAIVICCIPALHRWQSGAPNNRFQLGHS